MAQSVLSSAKSDSNGESGEEPADKTEGQSAAANLPPPADPLEAIVQRANLPAKALAAAKAICDEIRSGNMPLAVSARTLVSWAIGASRDGGTLSEAQGKKIVVAAIRVCRENKDRAGVAGSLQSTPVDKLIRKFGIVALFKRNETVFLAQEDRPYVILSVSRTGGSVVIAPVDDLQTATEVDPRELRKDPVRGDWPTELMDA